MPNFSAEAVARFEEVLRKEPKSQVFAPLAEAYRNEQRLAEAERVASQGVRLHPQFAGGWVVLGKILRDQKRALEAVDAFRKAVKISPENLLAQQCLGECLLELKDAKEALKTFKRILFLNPQAEKAKRIVAKLETLTADEYADEVFAMTRLAPLETAPKATSAPMAPAAVTKAPLDQNKALMRMLSLVDAFFVRNDLVRASQLLDETFVEFGEHPELQQRRILLQRRRASQLAAKAEHAEPLAPVASREEMIRQKKVQTLRTLLRKIEEFQSAPLTS